MAVDKSDNTKQFRARRLVVGANVALATLLVIAIVGVVQWGGYRFSGRSDWTGSAVNSLSAGTQNLLDGLDEKVSITTAYFQTNLEGEDQAKFRAAVQDLVSLYQIENRAQIEVASFNPLEDHDKQQALLASLRDKSKFKEQSAKHRELLDSFDNEVAPAISTLFDGELGLIEALGELSGDGAGMAFGQIEMLLRDLLKEVGAMQQDIDDAVSGSLPRYGAAASAVRSFYTNLKSSLQNIATVGTKLGATAPNLSARQTDFLVGAENRYQALIESLDQQIEASGDLPKLDLEDIARELAPNANAIIVETENDAKVVRFADVWPPLNPGGPTSVAFKDRAFRGEEKLSAAILQLTQQEKTAVVFARYGGPPLFFGGFMPNQPRPAYAQVKLHLEDLNFEVHEWDLSTQTEPPEIDPPPTKTIYVVLKPVTPPMNPMMRQQQQPTFGPEHREAVLTAVKDAGRALFITGWDAGQMGPMGPMPGGYQYGGYLSDTWGIDVDSTVLLLRATSIGPGKYQFGRGAGYMTDLTLANQPIVERLKTLRTILPEACPLTLAETPPDGVTLEKLAWCEQSDGLWGIRDFQAYRDQMHNEYMVKAPGDPEGPFTVAAAASSDDAKVVVVASSSFSTDDLAFARDLMLTAEGLAMRSRCPGNVTLLVNSLHWLNDNESIMDLGRPIDAPTLEIAEGPALAFIGAVVWGLWPAAIGCCGLTVWYIRRR